MSKAVVTCGSSGSGMCSYKSIGKTHFLSLS